ncbi:hypothetical protein MPC4_1180002 [Methylocella tundrae]|uniref:Uncharacterized protein n=1 Tax=Methylocella tundrae TaxID=227605 RepID=A0A8B6M293_METTU|nr:hypothetical protein MPC4_1180002 [Methylocella tundrae]
MRVIQSPEVVRPFLPFLVRPFARKAYCPAYLVQGLLELVGLDAKSQPTKNF